MEVILSSISGRRNHQNIYLWITNSDSHQIQIHITDTETNNYHSNHNSPCLSSNLTENKGLNTNEKLYLYFYFIICSKLLKKQKNSNSCYTVTGVVKLQPRHSFPHGSSHTCIPPPPSLAFPGLRLRSAGAQPQCEPWTGRSGNRWPGGGGPLHQYPALQTQLQMGQTGSCTDQNTVCCALLLCRIRLLSRAVRMTDRGKIRLNIRVMPRLKRWKNQFKIITANSTPEPEGSTWVNRHLLYCHWNSS